MRDTPLWQGAPGGARVDVVGLGQSSLDQVWGVRGVPPPGGKQAVHEFRQSPGGQISTGILACVRLGLSGAFAGTVGDDEAATTVLAPLAKAGVDLTAVQRVPNAQTQRAVILVDPRSGERTVLWYRDPRLSLEKLSLDPSVIEQGRALLLDASDPPVSLWAAEVARERGIPVVLDVDTLAPGVPELLRRVDFPVVSQEFAESHLGPGSLREGLSRLVEAGARMAVVTLGASGALAVTRDGVLESPAFTVSAVDTTGAGDVFRAGFLWALLEGQDATHVLRTANAAAATSCLAMGAQGGLPTLVELEAFFATHVPGHWKPPARAAEGAQP